MKWFLFPLALLMSTAGLSQGTLKIYVTLDDSRHDMDIIDLNTSAIDNYGVSVDSTNINYYTTTMSTQVVRLSYEQLFGPEEEFEMDVPVASMDFLLEEEDDITSQETSSIESPEPALRNDSQASRVVAKQSYTRPKTKKATSSKRLKKSKRFKKYKGKCPKF